MADIMPPPSTCREYLGRKGYCRNRAISAADSMGREFCMPHHYAREAFTEACKRGFA